MQRVQTHHIEIGEEVLPFRFSLMSYMHYFELTGKEATTISTTSDAIIYFYCAFKSGCEYERIECSLTLPDWMNLIDDYPESIENITKRFESTIKKK